MEFLLKLWVLTATEVLCSATTLPPRRQISTPTCTPQTPPALGTSTDRRSPGWEQACPARPLPCAACKVRVTQGDSAGVIVRGSHACGAAVQPSWCRLAHSADMPSCTQAHRQPHQTGSQAQLSQLGLKPDSISPLACSGRAPTGRPDTLARPRLAHTCPASQETNWLDTMVTLEDYTLARPRLARTCPAIDKGCLGALDFQARLGNAMARLRFARSCPASRNWRECNMAGSNATG